MKSILLEDGTTLFKGEPGSGCIVVAPDRVIVTPGYRILDPFQAKGTGILAKDWHIVEAADLLHNWLSRMQLPRDQFEALVGALDNIAVAHQRRPSGAK